MSQSLQCYCPTNTLPDPVLEAIFLAQCFENLFYPPNCQFPFSLSVVFQLLSWNFSLLLSKHQCYPAGSPPTFSPTIAHVPFCCLCWKELPTCIQNASFSSNKAILSNHFHFYPCNQLQTEKWPCLRGWKKALFVLSSSDFGLLSCIYLDL